MLALISSGIGFGFTAGSIPGPLHTFLVNETLIRGGRRSFVIAFSPLITDTPLIILMVLVLGQLPATLISLIQLIGGLFLLVLARNAWQSAQQIDSLTDNTTAEQFTLGQAILINWLNPAPYIFWGTIAGPLLVDGLAESVWHGAGFLLAFYGTFIGMMLGVVLIFDRLRALDVRVVRWLLRFSALVLIFFAGSLITSGLSDLF